MMTPLGVCGGVHEMDIFNKQEVDDMMIIGPGSEKGCSVMSIFNQNREQNAYNIQLFAL